MSSQQTIQSSVAPPSIIAGDLQTCEVCGQPYQARAWKTVTCGNGGCASKVAWDKRGRKTLEERYWAFVDKTPGQGPWGDCWGWLGCTVGDGYGQIGNGKSGKSHRPIRAHQVSYRLHYGALPEGHQVCHECDNPPCSNPHHLIAGTALENVSNGAMRRHIAELDALTDSLSSLPDFPVNDPAFDAIVNRLSLQPALALLSDRQRQLITMHFGLEDGCELTLAEVGVEIGVTRERVRQIEIGALKRLRRFYAGHLLKGQMLGDNAR